VAQPQLDRAERDRLQKLGLRLEWGTIAWNLGEAVITVVLGLSAGSIALVAFGLDSLIEVFASAVVVWHVRDLDDLDPTRNRTALRLISVAFAALGLALLAGAVIRIVSTVRPEESPWGIAYMAFAAVVMFGLAIAKRRVADTLDNAPLRAEAGITYLDGVLASAILFALVMNSAFGWWWADSLAAIAVALVALREAREHWAEAGGHGPST
jgi:divalent metal cation (Fe/Co/Zn/Cd) transporter